MEKKIFHKFDMKPVIDSMTKEAETLLSRYNKMREEFDLEPSKPQLAIISIGNDMASKVYVNNKVKKCAELGVEAKVYSFSDATYLQRQLEAQGGTDYTNSEDLVTKYAGFMMYKEIIDAMMNLSANFIPTIVQLPIDSNLLTPENKKRIESMVPSILDVDGFHPTNMGKLIKKNPYIMPCTVYGVMKTIEQYNGGNLDLRKKKVCVIGRSPIVGFPLIMQLIAHNAKVTHINSTHNREDLFDAISNADIIVSAVGKYGVITDRDVCNTALFHNKKVLVIDVGINRDADGKLVGDFRRDNEEVIENYHLNKNINTEVWYTPVPGGVGRLTVLGVVINTLKLEIQKLEYKYGDKKLKNLDTF